MVIILICILRVHILFLMKYYVSFVLYFVFISFKFDLRLDSILNNFRFMAVNVLQ